MARPRAQPRKGSVLAKLAITALALAALAAAGVLALPTVVENRALAFLDQAGIDDAALVVESVGWRETVVSGIRISDGLSIDRVVVRYAPDEAIEGRVREITASGLVLRAALGADGLSLGALDRLLTGGGAAASTPVSTPVGWVVLHGARVELAIPAGAATVDFDGDIVLAGDAFDATFRITGGDAVIGPFTIDGIRGDIGARGTGAALEGIDVELALDSIALPIGPAAAGTVSATLAWRTASLRGDFRAAGEAIRVSASATVADIGREASPFAIEAAFAVADPAALGGAAPALSGVTGKGRAELKISGVLPDIAALGGAADLRAALAPLALAGMIELALDDVTLPDVATGISLDGAVAVEAAGGALTVTATRRLMAAATPGPALLDALDPPAALGPYLAGAVALDLDALLIHAVPSADAIAVDAALGGRAMLAGGASLSANLDGTAEFGPAGELRRFSLRRLDATAQGLTVAGAPASLDDIHLDLAGEPGDFTGSARLRIALDRVEAAGIVLEEPRAVLGGSLAYRDGKFAMTFDDATSLAARRLLVSDVAQTTSPLALHAAGAGKSSLEATFDPAGAVVRYRLHLVLPPLEGDGLLPDGQAVPWSMAAAGLRLEGSARLDDGTHAGTIAVAGASLTLPMQEIALEGIDGEFHLDGGDAAEGRLASFTVDALRQLGAAPLVVPLRLAGTLDRDGGGLAFSGRVSDRQDRLTIRLSGAHDPAGGAGHADFTLEPLVFEPGRLDPADLAPPLHGMVGETSGTLAARGRLEWSASKFASAMTLLVEDLSLITGGVRLERVNAVIAFDSLWPPSTPPGQQVAIGQVDVGLPLTDGLVAFRLAPDGRLEIENADWRWAGGVLRTRGLVIDPGAARHDFTLDIEGLDLAEIVALAEVGGLEVSGRLNGRIPVAVTEAGVVIADGRLDAAGGGVLRYAPSGAPAALRGAGEGATLMLDALGDFRYQALGMTLAREADGATKIELHLTGANPAFYDGYPVELNLAISGDLDHMLRRGLEGYRVPEAIRQRIQGFGG